MQLKCKHFVVTRLGVGIYDEARLMKLIELFEAVTLPSLLHQSSQEFIWLVGIDAAIPEVCRFKLEKLFRGHSHYHLVPIDVTNLLHVRVACFDWVWDCYQDFILETGLLEDPGDYVITSVIDADDAWHRDVIATVSKLVADKLPAAAKMTESRGTWLMHSAGLAITFPNGYAWYISDSKIWPMKEEFRSMAVFIASRFSSGISACSCRHTKWRQYSEILEFEVIPWTGGQPMWIYTRHDEAVGNWDSNPAMPMPAVFEGRLVESFGIDIAKLKNWCATYPPHYSGTKGFSQEAALQFDLFFQIAGLNRKIRALSKRLNSEHGKCFDRNQELEECKAKRERLITMLQHIA